MSARGSDSPTIRLVIGSLLGLVALWLALRGTDAAAVWLSLAEAAPGWVLAAGASVVITIAAGVVRWRLLLGSPEGLPHTVVANALIVGQMLNVVLPIRLGELARAYIVSRSEAIPAARVFTTIAVEKLADLMLIGVTAGLLIMFATLPDWLHGPGAALVATGLLAAVAAAFGLRPGAIPWAGRLATRLAPTAWRPRIQRQFTLAGEGLTALQNRATSVEFWLLTTATVLLAASTNYLLFFAFDLRLSPVTAMVLLLSLQVGTTIAPAPGNLGVFHYVVVLVLTAYGVDRTTALAYALALYAVAILPKVGVGGILLAFQYRWILGPAGVRA
jgi:hypothetical protein